MRKSNGNGTWEEDRTMVVRARSKRRRMEMGRGQTSKRAVGKGRGMQRKGRN